MWIFLWLVVTVRLYDFYSLFSGGIKSVPQIKSCLEVVVFMIGLLEQKELIFMMDFSFRCSSLLGQLASCMKHNPGVCCGNVTGWDCRQHCQRSSEIRTYRIIMHNWLGLQAQCTICCLTFPNCDIKRRKMQCAVLLFIFFKCGFLLLASVVAIKM